jgi:sucrose-phosphate synthase
MHPILESTSSTKPLFIVLISMHGLIRGHDLELGRDADTGGQTKYVVELAKALARQPNIERVDLLTRKIADPAVSADYAVPIEPLSKKARIIRIEAGPDEYIAKEDLWPYLDGFTDNALTWLYEQNRMPDILHTHYADAGYVGVRISHLTGLPLVHTGHSLGRDKARRLLALGMSRDEIESRYHMARRIAAEEETLSNADLVITSTRNEIEDQYELYDCYSPEQMVVLPPGTDLQQFHPPKAGEKISNSFSEDLDRFLRDPDKPIILALSRPDERKNIVSLLEAYGQSPLIQDHANLVIVAGNRDDIRELNEGAQSVLTELLLIIDFYNLYGRVALPKHHTANDVPDIYRLVASSGGIFVNPALTEPFGLTLLEAAASGLPLVATENGGPVDIIGACKNGLLVDPLDCTAIATALIRLLTDKAFWQSCSENGISSVARYYSWDFHAQAYLQHIRPLTEIETPPLRGKSIPKTGVYRKRAIFTAVDNTLIGDADGLQEFVSLVRKHRKSLLFGIATGRRLDSVLSLLKANGVPMPDMLITSLGTEIYYASQLIADRSWKNHINHLWTPQELRQIIEVLPGIERQPKSEQSRFKISYYYDSSIAPSAEEIISLLRQHELSVNPTFSFGQYLDLVPARASKGQALRYAAHNWDIPLNKILVTGGSGGDDDMLRGNTLGVVVANRHLEELSDLSEVDQIYFSEQSHAWGILEAMRHYDFLSSD